MSLFRKPFRIQLNLVQFGVKKSITSMTNRLKWRFKLILMKIIEEKNSLLVGNKILLNSKWVKEKFLSKKCYIHNIFFVFSLINLLSRAFDILIYPKNMC